MDDGYLPNDLVNQSEFGQFPKINYKSNMDLRSTPMNITEIDANLNDMKNKIHQYNDSWLIQVDGLVSDLKKSLSIDEN
jgi:DMSO/TMAO reductase YedYZ molybdopterin-dependent catalytic subunit